MPQKICQACLLAKFWIPRNYLDFNRVRNILDLGLGLSKISQNSHTPKRAMSRVSRVVIVWTTEVSTMKTNLIDYCNIIIIDGSIILVVQHYRFAQQGKIVGSIFTTTIDMYVKIQSQKYHIQQLGQCYAITTVVLGRTRLINSSDMKGFVRIIRMYT